VNAKVESAKVDKTLELKFKEQEEQVAKFFETSHRSFEELEQKVQSAFSLIGGCNQSSQQRIDEYQTLSERLNKLESEQQDFSN
jgi:hypothetical protein